LTLCALTHTLLTAEKAWEILREVKEAQETFRKQRDMMKLEAEVHILTYASPTFELVCHLQTLTLNINCTEMFRARFKSQVQNTCQNATAYSCIIAFHQTLYWYRWIP